MQVVILSAAPNSGGQGMDIFHYVGSIMAQVQQRHHTATEHLAPLQPEVQVHIRLRYIQAHGLCRACCIKP